VQLGRAGWAVQVGPCRLGREIGLSKSGGADKALIGPDSKILC
jgi:hypothetical protein